MLEIGTRRVAGMPSTVHRDWVPHAAKYIGCDFASGQDVDVVADVCELSSAFGEQSFDAIISCSVLEHIQYPWVAAVGMCRTLKVGGFMFVMTHQTFPIHAYPHDYYRFTKEGLQKPVQPAARFGLRREPLSIPGADNVQRTRTSASSRGAQLPQRDNPREEGESSAG